MRNYSEKIRKRFFTTAQFAGLLICIYHTCELAFLLKKPLYSLITLTSALGMVLSYYFSKINKIKESYGVFYFCTYVALTVLVWLAGGMKAHGLAWYAVYVMMAALLSGRKYALFFSVISIFVFITFFIFNNILGINSNILVPVEKFYLVYFFISVGVLFISTLLVFQYMQLYDNYHKQLEEKNNEINTLLRVLIHDISNPLMIAKHHAKKPSENSNEKIINLLDIINLTINNVRQIKASEDGKLQVNLSVYNVSELLCNVIEVFEVKLYEKGLTLKITNPDDPKVLVDKNIFTTQILNNLISNSIKFSNTEGIIDISVKEEEDKVQISIKDNGIGIPESVLDKVFEYSSVTTRAGTQGEKGTGFGMPIVNSFLQKFNGKISIKSSTGDLSYTEIILDLPKEV